MTQSGKSTVPAMTVAAILSLSLVVNLPGLAVTPMLSTLNEVFPGTPQIEKQLLTVLPNLLIIPFVLLSGKLSLTSHKQATIMCALVMFVASAIAYLFARSMVALIIISCVLGCGAGLLIPFAAGLVADCFTGKERMKMMGIKSGISNLSLVAATFAVGWLASSNWHLPFVVYLIGVIPLLLVFNLRNIPSAPPQEGVQQMKQANPEEAQAASKEKVVGDFYVGRIGQLLAVYSFITFATMVISYYCPFLVEKDHWSDSLSGTITALMFLFVFLPGFTLTRIVRWFKGYTFIVAAGCMFAGLALFALVGTKWGMCVGASIAGLGYGISQPMIYDKASRAVSDQRKATLSLAIVLAANYVAITLTPFIVDAFRTILHAHDVKGFSFYLSAAMLLIYVIVALWKRKSFVFNVPKSFYS